MGWIQAEMADEERKFKVNVRGGHEVEYMGHRTWDREHETLTIAET
jgi:hypothetical protein